MKAGKWFVPMLAGVLVVGGVLTWQYSRNHQATGEQPTTNGFQAILERAGFQVEKTAETNLYSMFGLKPGSSTGYWTSSGVLDVAVFPEVVEGRLRIEEVGGYNWEIHGWNNEPHHFGSNRPQYFIVHRNLFIMTDAPTLASSIKAALH